jgi:hypothetical protein
MSKLDGKNFEQLLLDNPKLKLALEALKAAQIE